MRFSATTTASILFSLLALEAVGAPAPQYDTTIIVSTTVEAAAGSAIDTSSPAASAATSARACKAKPKWAQAWAQHRRPQPSAIGGAASSQEVPSEIPSSGGPEPSIVPITSVLQAEPRPVETQMPAVVDTAPVVAPTAIQAGGDGEVLQSPPSQVAQPSVVETSSAFESSYSYESSSSSSWSSSARPAASAQAGSGAPAGFEADILAAHNVFRATWGPLVWNQSLADKGTNYYKDKACVMKHSGMADIGENLASGMSGFGAAAEPLGGQGVVDMWGAESEYWTKDALAPSDDPNKVTGHFTQVVWKSTTQLGCGEFICGSSWLAFCEYYPAGNWKGEYGPHDGIAGQVGWTS